MIYDPKNRLTDPSLSFPHPAIPSDASAEKTQVMHADGFEDAVVGIAEGFGGKRVIIYSYVKCVEILMERHGMDEAGASEFVQFNLLGAWVGEGTPMLLFEMDYEDILDALE